MPANDEAADGPPPVRGEGGRRLGGVALHGNDAGPKMAAAGSGGAGGRGPGPRGRWGSCLWVRGVLLVLGGLPAGAAPVSLGTWPPCRHHVLSDTEVGQSGARTGRAREWLEEGGGCGVPGGGLQVLCRRKSLPDPPDPPSAPAARRAAELGTCPLPFRLARSTINLSEHQNNRSASLKQIAGPLPHFLSQELWHASPQFRFLDADDAYLSTTPRTTYLKTFEKQLMGEPDRAVGRLLLRKLRRPKFRICFLVIYHFTAFIPSLLALKSAPPSTSVLSQSKFF